MRTKVKGASSFKLRTSKKDSTCLRTCLAPRTSHLAAGMTLIETVIWIAVTTLILIALMSSVLYFYRTNRYAIEQASATVSAQRGIERMVRTIREAAYSSKGAFPVVSIAANEFVFYADTDADPLIERVRYYIDGTDLKQGVVDPAGDPPSYSGAESSTTAAEHVRNVEQNVSVFRYWDGNGAEITNYGQWSEVRFVVVSLVTNVDPILKPDQLILNSSAALRNLTGR